MSIQVSNITKYYGSQKALDNVSFEIHRGEIAGFIGPNGAGKSTMMKIITGFLSPHEGKVLISGLNTIEHPLKIREKFGYLSEHNPLYGDMYIKEYLMHIAGFYRLKITAEERIKELIELCGLEAEQHKKIQSLSKGYRQRVGLAQAIIHDPEVLILDEPTTGLDPNQIVGIRKLIADLGKEKTLMLSTHIMQEVEAICQRVIIINNGRIVADGKPGSISSPSTIHPQTILIEFDNPPDIGLIRNIGGVISVQSLPDKRMLIETEPDQDLRPILFNFAVEHGLTVLSMHKKEKNMEEEFREATGEK